MKMPSKEVPMTNKLYVLAEKICRALEELKLWGIHKDAESLKLMLKELETPYEITRSVMSSSVDCDPLEYPREVSCSRVADVPDLQQDQKLDGCGQPKPCS